MGIGRCQPLTCPLTTIIDEMATTFADYFEINLRSEWPIQISNSLFALFTDLARVTRIEMAKSSAQWPRLALTVQHRLRGT
jgi:hypothetical protein